LLHLLEAIGYSGVLISCQVVNLLYIPEGLWTSHGAHDEICTALATNINGAFVDSLELPA
jgi:hypothetical protein